MLVEIEHHYGWTLHDEPVDDLFEAAKRAVEVSHWEIFTPDNHRLERGAWSGPTTHNGSVKVITLKALPPCPLFGDRPPGDYWFSCSYRRHFPHGTTALDRHGRRWAHVSVEGYPRESGPYRDGPKPWRSACSQWACLDDPREMRRDYPSLFEENAADFAIGGDVTPATAEELRRARMLTHDTWSLHVMARVASRHLTPKQAAHELRLRGPDRVLWLARRAWRMAEALERSDFDFDRDYFGRKLPDDLDLHEAIDRLLRVAGIADLVAAERDANRRPVRPRRTA